MLDPSDRVLLFQFQLPAGMISEGPARFWATPGGAIEADEDARVAVEREVREETGIADFEVGPELWVGEQSLTLNGVPTFCRERFFLVRAATSSISSAGWTELEKEVMQSHRWWSVQDLLTSEETIYPLNFGRLVEQFLREGTSGVQRIPL
jgi:8-oxo-dGTP diphosphatase